MTSVRLRRPGEAVFAALMLALSLFLFWHAYRISGFSALSSPGALPLAATGVMVIAASIIFMRTLSTPAAGGGLGAFRREVVPGILGVFAGIIFIYGAALEATGFLIASLVFLTVSITMLHRRGPLVGIGHALVSVATIYVIFRLIFQVVLPEGIVPERRILADIERAFARVIGR